MLHAERRTERDHEERDDAGEHHPAHDLTTAAAGRHRWTTTTIRRLIVRLLRRSAIGLALGVGEPSIICVANHHFTRCARCGNGLTRTEWTEEEREHSFHAIHESRFEIRFGRDREASRREPEVYAARW